MAIVVEDGSIVTGANSYISEAELTTYATNRGITLTATASVLIYKAMDYLESLNFIGIKYTEDQPLQWPRSDVWIDGYPVEATEIPLELKNAQYAVCVAIDTDADPLASIAPSVKKEKVGDLEVEYQDGAGTNTTSTAIRSATAKLVASGGGSATFSVSRA